MNVWLTVGMAAAGALSGPTLRAAIFRYSVAAGRPWRETCPHCNAPAARRTPIRARALPASGRCPSCRTPVGPPAGVVEIIAASVLALLAWRVHDPITLIGLGWAGLTGVVLGFVDLNVHRLPNRMVLTGLTGTVAVLAVASAAHGEQRRLGTAAACGLGTAAIYLVLSLIPSGYGLGDIKTGTLTGFAAGWFGLGAAAVALLLGLTLTGLAGLVLILLGRRTRADAIAHGPFMFVGALLAITASA